MKLRWTCEDKYKLTPGERRRYKGLLSYSEQSRQKRLMKLRSDYRAAVMMKPAYTTNQENQLRNPFMQVRSVAILAQKLSRSKWTLWHCQTTCSTGFVLIFWFGVCNPAFLVFCASLPFSWLPIARVKMHAHFLAWFAAFFCECWFSSWFCSWLP